tara:strand:+ start:71 stop:274 length:204 start_codon:yes stop_codon:yes gene_type:complete
VNSFFKKWIREAVGTREDVFSSNKILEEIVSKYGTSQYIGSVSAIGWYLARLDNVERIKENRYRVVI